MPTGLESTHNEVVRQVGPETFLSVERVFTVRQMCTCGTRIPMASDEKHAKCIAQEWTCPKCQLTWRTCTPAMPRDGRAWELKGKLVRNNAKKGVLPKKEA